MINIMAIDHVVFRTTKLPQMLDFYIKILNCKLERALPEQQGLTQLRAGNALIDIVTVDSDLGRLGGKAPQQNGRNVDHICLVIANIEEAQLINYLQQHKVPMQPFADRYGAQGFGRSIYIEDPERNVVELKLDNTSE